MLRTKYRSTIGAIAMSLALGQGLEARVQVDLADTTTLDCSFGVLATAGWDDGDADASVDPSTLSLRFEEQLLFLHCH